MNNTEGNKLSDKIREVFDNYEDEGAAEGWEQLRRKYPARDSRPVYLWISSIAAVLLLSTAVWFWPAGIENNDSANNKAQLTNDSVVSNNNSAKVVSPESPTEVAHLEDQALDKNVPKIPDNDDRSAVADIESSPVNAYSNSPKAPELHKDNTHAKITTPGQSTQPKDIVVRQPELIESTHLLAKSDNLVKQAENPGSAMKVEEVSVLPGSSMVQFNQTDSIGRSAISPLPMPAKLLAGLETAAENTELPVQDAKQASHALSVYGGSFINFAAGSESALNFAAGLSSDLKISSRLKLSTGISLARNSLSFENGVPEKARLNDALSFNSPNNVPSGNLVSLNNYTAELINLDIPINLKYQVGQGKNDFFISAGLSSGTFVSERYVSDYRSYNLNSGAYFGQTISSNKVNKEFAEFDFARTFNFSFGFTTGFGKKQNLTFEPFLKYPLGGLGTQDILFGSSGINIKLNLSKND